MKLWFKLQKLYQFYKKKRAEIKQRNAAENIALLEEKYLQATTVGEKSNIMQQISDQQRALDTNEWQKAFSSIAYGTIAAYAERLGTLNYICVV